MSLLVEGVRTEVIDGKARLILEQTKIPQETPFDAQRKLALSTKIDKKTRLVWMEHNAKMYVEQHPSPAPSPDDLMAEAEDMIERASASSGDVTPEWVDIDNGDDVREFQPAAQVALNKVQYQRAFADYSGRYLRREEAKDKAQAALNIYLESLIALALETDKTDHYIELAQFTLPEGFALPECYKKNEYDALIAQRAAKAAQAAPRIAEELNSQGDKLTVEELNEKVSALANAADLYAKAGQTQAAALILEAMYSIIVPAGMPMPEAKLPLPLITKVTHLDESKGKELMTTHIRRTVAAAMIQDARYFNDAMRLAKVYWGEEFITAEMHFYEALLVEAPGKGVDRNLKKFEEHINKAIAKAPNVYLYYEYPYKVFLDHDEAKAHSFLSRTNPHFNAAFTLELGDNADKFIDNRKDPKNFMQGKNEYNVLQTLLSGEDNI